MKLCDFISRYSTIFLFHSIFFLTLLKYPVLVFPPRLCFLLANCLIHIIAISNSVSNNKNIFYERINPALYFHLFYPSPSSGFDISCKSIKFWNGHFFAKKIKLIINENSVESGKSNSTDSSFSLLSKHFQSRTHLFHGVRIGKVFFNPLNNHWRWSLIIKLTLID